MLRRLGLPAVLVAALALAPAALADAGIPNYSSKLTSVAPKLKGLTVRVVDGDDAIELRNATGLNVMVPGYENEPYLRFLVGGRVEVNVNSPAKYLNEERYGGVTVPKEASAKAKPKWELIAQGGAYTWHEHRVHWMSTEQPPRVKAAGGRTLQKVFDWVVPLGVGGERVKASGTLWWVPTGELRRADALIAAAVAKEAGEKKAAATTAAAATTQAATSTQAATTQAATTEATATEAAPTEAEESAAPVAAPGEADSTSPILWVAIVVLALALAGVAGYAFRLRRRAEPGQPAGEVW